MGVIGSGSAFVRQLTIGGGVTAIAAAIYFASSSKARRLWALGFLFGLAIMGLLVGLCFVAVASPSR